MAGAGDRREHPRPRAHIRVRSRSRSRAAILLEVLLAIVLFVSSASVLLSLLTQAMADMARVRERQAAVDAARTIMGEIEAGVVSPEAAIGIFDPRDRAASAAGASPAPNMSGADAGAGGGSWWVDVDTQPTEFDSLTLVRVSVSRAQDSSAPPPRASSSDADPGVPGAIFTLSQLVRVIPASAPDPTREMDGFENVEPADSAFAEEGAGGRAP